MAEPTHTLLDGWPVPPPGKNARFVFTYIGESDIHLPGWCLWEWIEQAKEAGYICIRKFDFADEANKCWDMIKRGVPVETIKEIYLEPPPAKSWSFKIG